jgi:hypothetical protein
MITSVSLKRTAKVAALTVALSASSAGAALAGTHVTSGDNSILGGNQINAPISVPVNVCGNALAILGTALAGCEGGASVSGGSGHGTWVTSGNNSIGGGNQVNAPISVPVNICGNSAAVLGTALSGCRGGAHVGGSHHRCPPPPCKCPPPPCKHHHQPPPPCKHHHQPPPGHHHHHHMPPPGQHHPHMPPPGHHHGGGGGTTTTTTSTTVGSTLPTTGANIVGLLVLAGSVTLAGAGSLTLLARRSLARGALAITRRATRVFAGAR